MRYSLLVSAGPEERAGLTALHTAEALLRRGHDIHRVFFYRNGVHLASRSLTDSDSATGWQRLILDRDLPATVCVGAASRRGTADPAEGFTLGGLGDWAEALAGSEKVLSFGR